MNFRQLDVRHRYHSQMPLSCRELAWTIGFVWERRESAPGHLQTSASVVPMSALTLESRHRPAQRAPAEMTQTEFFVGRYIASAGRSPGEHIFSLCRACLNEQALQIRFMILSPTTRRSSLLIRSERSTSAALMAAIVWRNVLTFDPSDTIPPSTTAIDPMAAT
jgi:hypothetical protein